MRVVGVIRNKLKTKNKKHMKEIKRGTLTRLMIVHYELKGMINLCLRSLKRQLKMLCDKAPLSLV